MLLHLDPLPPLPPIGFCRLQTQLNKITQPDVPRLGKCGKTKLIVLIFWWHLFYIMQHYMLLGWLYMLT